MGKDPIQRIPADIIVAIAGGRGKMPLGNPFLLEGSKDPRGILRFNGLNTGKYRGKACPRYPNTNAMLFSPTPKVR